MGDGNTSVEGAAEAAASAKASTVRRTALQACVQLMRRENLTGAARDKASRHFLAGAASVAGLAGVSIPEPGDDGSYTDVLEALAAEPAE